MTPQEQFITWLKGFVAACHEYQPTPKQWDQIKDELSKLDPPAPVENVPKVDKITETESSEDKLKKFLQNHPEPTQKKYPWPISAYPKVWQEILDPFNNEPLGPTYADSNTFPIINWNEMFKIPLSCTTNPGVYAGTTDYPTNTTISDTKFTPKFQ